MTETDCHDASRTQVGNGRKLSGIRLAMGLKCVVVMLFVLLSGENPVALAAAGEPAVAVLSSETGPYREALAGFQDGFGASVQTFVLSREKPDIPRATKVVVAFGAKAVLRSYPDQATVINVIAPGAQSTAETAITVRMELGAGELLAGLKQVDPGLHRLGVLWQSPHLTDYVEELRKAGVSSGMTIERATLEDNSEVPDSLRRLFGKIDAIWLPPDPLLLNADTLSMLVGFSRSNRIPLFVPTSGLVERGATAAIGPTFREMGRLAGIAARNAVSGRAQESRIYSDRAEIVISRSAAAEIGLEIPEETLRRKANRVLP